MEININIATNEQDYNDCLNIRKKVFIEEQNIDENIEYDDLKIDACYIIAKVGLISVGTARYRKTSNGIKLERFAVLKEYRNLGIGKALVLFLLKKLKNGENIYLNSQKEVVNFYLKFGFKIVGDIFYEANIAHYKMKYIL